MTTKSSSKPEMAAEIPELIRDPSRANTCYERGRFLGKVKKKTRGKNLCQKFGRKNSSNWLGFTLFSWWMLQFDEFFKGKFNLKKTRQIDLVCVKKNFSTLSISVNFCALFILLSYKLKNSWNCVNKDLTNFFHCHLKNFRKLFKRWIVFFWVYLC